MSKKVKLQNGKKKFKKRYIVIGLIVVVIGGSMAYNMMKPAKPLTVTTEEAETEEIKETLDLSGLIQSSKTQSYFAEVNALIKECNVTEGQEVHMGDILIKYDITELENQYKQAQLESEASGYSYDESIRKGNESSQEKVDAQKQIDSLKAQIQNKKSDITSIQNQISQRNDELTVQQEKESSQQAAAAVDTESVAAFSSVTSNEVTAINKQMTDLNTKLTNAQEELTELQTELSKQESIVEQADAGILSENQKLQLNATDQVTKLTAATAKNQLDKAQSGITAAFDGVVTGVQSVAGGYAAQGTQLFTLKSNKDMVLQVSLSKYDLEKVEIGQSADIIFSGRSYSGSVVKLENSAQQKETGTPYVNMQIKIDNPDNKLFIGMEGKAELEIAKKQSAVTIPIEAINSDKNGDFCYVLSDGVIKRRDITAGISSSERTEVIEGVKAGDKIITNTTDEVKDGVKATENQ